MTVFNVMQCLAGALAVAFVMVSSVQAETGD